MSDKQVNIDPSYFLKLLIEGVNCFKDEQILDLSDGKGNYSPWTIILGDNGTGKTTLLRILDRMQSYKEDSNNYFALYSYLSQKFTEEPHLIELSYISNKIIDTVYCHTNIDGINMGNSYKNNSISYLLSYGASRRMSKNQYISSKINDKFKTTSLFDDSIELINAEEWLLQKELLSERAEPIVKDKFEKQLVQVKTILVDILPDVHNIRVKPINENNSKLIIEVETDYGWVNIRDLSFGYQTLTALIVDIAAKMMEQYPDSEEPLKEAVIILIDEIDLHLHPKWQRTVIDKLSEHFPKAQFIATSHSPLIVQAAQDKGANIVVCRKEGDRVIIDNNPDEVKGWRIDQILVSDLFEIESSRSAKTQEKVDEYINSKRLDNQGEILKADLPEDLKNAIASEPESELDKKLKDFANKYLNDSN